MTSIEINSDGISTNSEDIIRNSAAIGDTAGNIAANSDSIKMLKTIAMLNW